MFHSRFCSHMTGYDLDMNRYELSHEILNKNTEILLLTNYTRRTMSCFLVLGQGFWIDCDVIGMDGEHLRDN